MTCLLRCTGVAAYYGVKLLVTQNLNATATTYIIAHDVATQLPGVMMNKSELGDTFFNSIQLRYGEWLNSDAVYIDRPVRVSDMNTLIEAAEQLIECQAVYEISVRDRSIQAKYIAELEKERDKYKKWYDKQIAEIDTRLNRI